MTEQTRSVCAAGLSRTAPENRLFRLEDTEFAKELTARSLRSFVRSGFPRKGPPYDWTDRAGRYVSALAPRSLRQLLNSGATGKA